MHHLFFCCTSDFGLLTLTRMLVHFVLLHGDCSHKSKGMGVRAVQQAQQIAGAVC